MLPPAKEVELRDYTMRLTSGVKSMFENFTEIIKLARVSCVLPLIIIEFFMIAS